PRRVVPAPPAGWCAAVVISPEDADALAVRMLAGLRTKTGGAHLAHARRVAAGVRSEALGGGDATAVAAALLHDVVEKGGVSIAELRVVTGDERVVELV